MKKALVSLYTIMLIISIILAIYNSIAFYLIPVCIIALTMLLWEEIESTIKMLGNEK